MKITSNLLRQTSVKYPILFVLSFLALYMLTAKAEKKTVYVIKRSSTLDQLDIHVDLEKNHPPMRLALKGVSMGIASQVKNMSCDGKPLIETKPGEWLIPKEGREIDWQTSLTEDSDASAQQSSRLNNFIVFSEVSSLPRLQNSQTEFIKIALSDVKKIVPEPRHNLIPLPAFSGAPMFVLLNANSSETLSLGPITLSYLLDTLQNKSQLPSIEVHLRGLQWLNEIIPAKNYINFTIGWLGTSSQQPKLTGAAGSDMLLVNYPIQGQFPFGKIMLLYVALHEAFHQLAMNHHDQPPWVAESLASYYGIRALQQVLPDDPDVSKLMTRFQDGGKNFKEGLLTINAKVEKGDRSLYGAFYTKGITFWAEIAKNLQRSHHQNLDKYILSFLKSNHSDSKKSSNLEKELHLSQQEWAEMRSKFLD